MSQSLEPSFRKVFGIFRGETPEILAITVYAAAAGILSLAVPLSVQMVVNTIALGSLQQQLVVLTSGTLFLILLMGAVRLLQQLSTEQIQRRLAVRISLSLANTLPGVRHSFFPERSGPEYVNRFMEVFAVQKNSAELLLETTKILFQIALGLILLSAYHPIFLLAAVIISLLCIVGVLATRSRGLRTSYAESDAKYSVLSWLEDICAAPSLFRSPRGREYANARTSALLEGYLQNRASHFRLLQGQSAFVFVLQGVAFAWLLGMGGTLVAESQLTLGQLVAAELVLASVLNAVTKGTKQLENYYDLWTSAEKLSGLMQCGGPLLPIESVSELDAGINVKVREVKLPGSVASFDIPAGAKVGIAGNSLLADILAGERSAGSGSVHLDSLPIEEIPQAQLHEEVILLRTPALVHGTIEENLRLGLADLEFAEIRKAVEAVGLLQAVESLPERWKTPLHPGTQLLSAPMIVCLNIARALLARPRLLVVDALLDSIHGELRDRLLAGLQTSPATIVVFTRDETLLSRFEASMELPVLPFEQSGSYE